jgi:hypothetical protein
VENRDSFHLPPVTPTGLYNRILDHNQFILSRLELQIGQAKYGGYWGSNMKVFVQTKVVGN